jgi:hypothetical protein
MDKAGKESDNSKSFNKFVYDKNYDSKKTKAKISSTMENATRRQDFSFKDWIFTTNP